MIFKNQKDVRELCGKQRVKLTGLIFQMRVAFDKTVQTWQFKHISVGKKFKEKYKWPSRSIWIE